MTEYELPPISCSQGGFAYNGAHIEYWKSRALKAEAGGSAQESLGVAAISKERQRQINEEGWTAERDSHYWHGTLASAALCYVHAGIFGREGDEGFVRRYWRWDEQWWKPADTRQNFVKAGALIAAEIDRIDRASAVPSTGGDTP